MRLRDYVREVHYRDITAAGRMKTKCIEDLKEAILYVENKQSNKYERN